MLNQLLVVTRKEIVDSLRDIRALVSTLAYALMGPLVVGLVSLSRAGQGESGARVLLSMMSVFTLVAAFIGGLNVAMDAIAGERERRSLLPLLLNPVDRLDLILGKWLAICVFSVAGLVLNLLGFAVVISVSGLRAEVEWFRLLMVIAIGVLPLPILAASFQLLISTVCLGVKEAQTYLSLVVFLPMGVGFLLVFSPAAQILWFAFLPLLGQQLQLQHSIDGREIALAEPIVLGCVTLALAILVLLVAANRLQRDEIVYEN